MICTNKYKYSFHICLRKSCTVRQDLREGKAVFEPTNNGFLHLVAISNRNMCCLYTFWGLLIDAHRLKFGFSVDFVWLTLTALSSE